MGALWAPAKAKGVQWGPEGALKEVQEGPRGGQAQAKGIQWGPERARMEVQERPWGSRGEALGALWVPGSVFEKLPGSPGRDFAIYEKQCIS